VARVGDKKDAHREDLRKTTLGRPSHRWEDNIKIKSSRAIICVRIFKKYFLNIVTWLVAREDFIKSCRRESFKSYNIKINLQEVERGSLT
jgi:hypothetical protein